MEKSIKQIIKERKSTRDYSAKRIEEYKSEILKVEMNKLSTHQFRFEFINYTFDNDVKISTYGMIKGGHSFIIGILKKDLAFSKDAAVDFGYAFEQIILKATEIDLDTCWMASTFNSMHLLDVIEIEDNEDIAMVSPIGYRKEKSLKDKVTRFVFGSHKRKSWGELFYNESFNEPITSISNKKITEVLEAVRISPSAANKQPWRIVINNDIFDFYIVRNLSLEKKDQKINLNFNDIGIAKCHFEKTAIENEISVEWFKKEEYLTDNEYVGSFKIIK